MRWRPSPLVAPLVLAALALVGNLATNTVQVDAGWWPPLVWGAAVLLVATSVVLEVARGRGPGAADPARDDAAAVERLVGAVGARWRQEDEHRKVTDPAPLRVSWRPAPDDVVDGWDNVCRAPMGSTALPLDLTGSWDRIADVYLGIPSRRLVILGGGGSGKTVLATRLARDLLAARRPADPVPVVLGIGSWTPATPLRDWIAERITRDFAGVARHPGTAATLVADGRILPILDGFDEINPGLHGAALVQLNLAAELPLVLTSRSDEYARAVRDTDVLTSAAGIRLDDLTPEDVAHYLPRTTRRRTDDGSGLWEPVLRRLLADGDDPPADALRRVFRTPLMIYLARTSYSDGRAGDPVELLDAARFRTAGAIEEHLLTAYLPAVYRHPSRTGRTWPVDGSRRWLTSLARLLDRRGTRDLDWWRLRDAVSPATRVLVLASAGAVVGGLSYGIAIGRQIGALAGLLSGAAIGLVGGLIFGLVFGVGSIARRPVRTVVRFGRATLRHVGIGLAVGVAIGGVAGAVAADPRGGLLVGAAIGIVIGSTVGLEAPVDRGAAVSPRDLLASNRLLTVRRVLLVGVAGGLLGGLAAGVSFGAAFGLAGAWGQWLLFGRVWLPLTGRLPWRTSAFLEDAHERGILRQSGASYQFRHARLQGHLASSDGGPQLSHLNV